MTLRVQCNLEQCDQEDHFMVNSAIKFVHNIEEDVYYCTYLCPKTNIRESYQIFPAVAEDGTEISVEDLVWESRKPYESKDGQMLDGAEYVQMKNPVFSRRPTGFPPISEVDISAFCARMDADPHLGRHAAS